ncbi:MAG: type II toxin-antitoxin system RelE/ParE family toxin [Desulfobacteria bacterium]
MGRVFKTRHFLRWMRKTELSDPALCQAVVESGRRGPHGPRPPTPPYERFRIRRFLLFYTLVTSSPVVL